MKDFYLDQEHLSQAESCNDDDNFQADLIERGASIELLSNARENQT